MNYSPLMMTTLKTITARFINKTRAEEFYKDCKACGFYPWDIDSLRLSIARKPDYNQGWLVETWHYTADTAEYIEPWIAYMILRAYDIQVQPTDRRSIRKI